MEFIKILTQISFEYWLKCGLLKFRIVGKRKKIKNVSQRYGIFQISEHKSTTSIGQLVSL